MNKKLIFFLTIVLCGCEPKGIDLEKVSYRPVCLTEESKTKLAKFIVDCAKSANPMSDEEGEDLVKQCELTGKETICTDEKHCWNHDSARWERCK